MLSKRIRLDNDTILATLNNVDSDDEPDVLEDDSDDGESDGLAEELHLVDEEGLDSDEEAADPNGGVETDDDDDTPLGNMYFARGKDKQIIKLNKTPLAPANVRTRSSNIVMRLPGTKGAARDAKSERGCLHLFLDDQVIQVIVSSTNVYIDTVRQNFLRKRNVKDTDALKIRALIGVFLLTGNLGAIGKTQMEFGTTLVVVVLSLVIY